MKKNEAFVMLITGGIIYFYMEIAFRGYSHFSMILCGGLCFYITGLCGNYILEHTGNIFMSVVKIMLFGAVVITTLEFMTGYVVNVLLHQDVWDYSDEPYQIMGQICLPFSMLWSLISLVCVYLYGILDKYIIKGGTK